MNFENSYKNKNFIEKFKKKNLKYFTYWILILIAITSSVLIIFILIEKNSKQYVDSSLFMDKKVHQILFGPNSERISENVKSEISKLEECISHEIYGSDIERINSASGKWVKVQKITIDTLYKLIDISRRSRGIFDPTYLSLIKLYGSEFGQIKDIDQEKLDKILKTVDYKLIKIDSELNRVKIDNEVTKITLNDALEGLACEKAIEIYKNSKINQAIISIGNTTGYFKSKHSKKPNNAPVSDGFISIFENSDNNNYKVINARTGKIKNIIETNLVFHPTSGVISSILSRLYSLLTQEEIQEIFRFYGCQLVN
ncbi:MAG: FAD:protein FMN transferase [Firmicutes bacterium]|nr:FAD:protein FMN transferase [Bacillota bacterium]